MPQFPEGRSSTWDPSPPLLAPARAAAVGHSSRDFKLTYLES